MEVCVRLHAHPWHGTNVVLMTMSDNDCLNLVPPTMQEAGVWKDLLHAQISEAAPPGPMSEMHTAVHDVNACMRRGDMTFAIMHK